MKRHWVVLGAVLIWVAAPATQAQQKAPAVAKAKIEGLAKWYGINGDRDVAFFSVHMEADVAHSQTSREILRDLCDTPAKTAEAERAASRTLDALYGFLDSVTA